MNSPDKIEWKTIFFARPISTSQVQNLATNLFLFSLDVLSSWMWTLSRNFPVLLISYIVHWSELLVAVINNWECVNLENHGYY